MQSARIRAMINEWMKAFMGDLLRDVRTISGCYRGMKKSLCHSLVSQPHPNSGVQERGKPIQQIRQKKRRTKRRVITAMSQRGLNGV